MNVDFLLFLVLPLMGNNDQIGKIIKELKFVSTKHKFSLVTILICTRLKAIEI